MIIIVNESTAGADALVEVPKLHNIKLLYNSIDSKGKGLETHHVHQCFQQSLCVTIPFDLLFFELYFWTSRSFFQRSSQSSKLFGYIKT